MVALPDGHGFENSLRLDPNLKVLQLVRHDAGMALDGRHGGSGGEASSRPFTESRVTTIYEASAVVFVREGYAGATSRALSQASGVAESTLFRLVRDKFSLYRSLFDYAWSEANALVAESSFVADLDRPSRNTNPAEILIGDLRALAASWDEPRMRPLVTFAFDGLGRPAPGFDPGSSLPYSRFRARLESYAALDLKTRRRPRHADAALLANALLARVRGAWMAWHHTPEGIERRPTIDELTEQLRREFDSAGTDEESAHGGAQDLKDAS
jgi:AcrR family transcriptional regulator